MRAAIYARVSTDRQGRDQTIDSQVAALRRWAEDRGHELRPEHVFADDGFSGSRLDRPALDRLRDAAFAGEFDVIAVHSPDRLARRYAYQVLLMEEFRKAGCAVEFVQRPITDDPHDQLLLQIQGAIAEYERTVLSERFRRGKLQKARAGHWVSGRAPYGYRHVPKRDGVPGHLVVDEAEAAVVRSLYSWLIDEQMSLRQILKRLAEGPWRPRCGRRLWAAKVVHRILSDPLYAGTAYANRCTAVEPRKPRARGPQAGRPNCRQARPRSEWIAIPVPAIIDESTHQRALDQLARNASLSFRNNTRNEYLLRCLLTCRSCGLAMFGITRYSRDRQPRGRYYTCHGKDCVCRDRDRRCPQASTKAEEIEAAVWAHVKRLLEDPATLLAQFEALAREADDADDGPKWEAQLRRLDREEGRLLDAYQEGAIELPELKARREQIRLRRQAITGDRDRQSRQRAERLKARDVWRELSAFCGRIRSRLDEATERERQRILQLLIERVIVGDHELEIRHVIPLRGPGPEASQRPMPPVDPTGGSDAGWTPQDDPGARLRSDGVDLTPLDDRVRAPGPRHGRVQRLGAIQDEQGRPAGIEAAADQVLQQRRADRGVLAGALAQSEDTLHAVLRDAQGHDHRLPGVLDDVDHDHGEPVAVEPALGQGLHIAGRGPDEAAANARLGHAEAGAGHVNDTFVIAGAHAPYHAA
jgi:site-specific DNA recombinase